MKEEWKDIVGYEGLYQVSTLGRVKSNPRNGTSNTEHFLTIKVYPNCRYARVVLSKNNRTKSFSVHRLVAEAFIPNPDNLPQVNHRDMNTSNNTVENLEWCDAIYNNNYGQARTRAAKSCQKAIIGFDGIHKLGTYFTSTTDAATYFGVSKGAICGALKGYKYTHTSCGYTWEYA